MKMLALALAAIVTGSNAFAGTVNFICIETGTKSPHKIKLVLKQLGNEKADSYGDLPEGKKYQYQFNMYSGSYKQPRISTQVEVEREDVMVKINTPKHSRSKIESIIFLDEPTDSWLEINGGKTASNVFHLDCRKRTKIN